MSKGCVSCGRELHEECTSRISKKKCCCSNRQQTFESKRTPSPKRIYNKRNRSDYSETPRHKNTIGISAGRKRAAVQHKIDRERACEWRFLANCGGGLHPVVGCLKGKQEHRHHGPDKDTSNNATSNVHLICTRCHNTWHAKNDPHYNREKYATLPHNPRPATPDEMLSVGKA